MALGQEEAYKTRMAQFKTLKRERSIVEFSDDISAKAVSNWVVFIMSCLSGRFVIQQMVIGYRLFFFPTTLNDN